MQDNPRSNFQMHAAGKPVVDNVNIETAGPVVLISRHLVD
jgi:hypothetical protein